MHPRHSLRTEIIFNLLLLMGAALIFVCLLLLKFFEDQLIAQQVQNHSSTSVGLALNLVPMVSADQSGEGLAKHAREIIAAVDDGLTIESWALHGGELQWLAGSSGQDRPLGQGGELLKVRDILRPLEQLDYISTLVPFAQGQNNHLLVTVPLLDQGKFIGALQLRFGLEQLRGQFGAAQGWILLCVILYGLVLVLFGGYLLGSTVVRPVRLLMAQAMRVAQGDLGQLPDMEGPLEIEQLAQSFNSMTRALQQSRQQTEAHIQSLHDANEDLHRTRDALVRSEKMASVGHLAAGMAHEIGNPLAAVFGYLELLKADLPATGGKDIVEHALKEVGRIDTLVRELLDYAAPERTAAEVIDPLSVLDEAKQIVEHQGLLANHPLEVGQLPDQLPKVRVVRHKLLQVFVNLLLNALDASERAGRLEFAAGTSESEVWIRVSDQGSGMPVEVLRQIFEPFFTTKPPGKGRGLGLSVCQRVIEESGGRIEVRSVEGQGSEFSVYLPKADHHEA